MTPLWQKLGLSLHWLGDCAIDMRSLVIALQTALQNRKRKWEQKPAVEKPRGYKGVIRDVHM